MLMMLAAGVGGLERHGWLLMLMMLAAGVGRVESPGC